MSVSSMDSGFGYVDWTTSQFLRDKFATANSTKSDDVIADVTSTQSLNSVNFNVTNSSRKAENDDASYTSLYLSSWMWVLYIIIGLVGIVGNAFVTLVMLCFTNMRRRLTNVYVINQSLIDLMTSIFLLLTTLFQDQYLPPGLAGELKCRIWLTKLPFWASYISSSMNLIAITLERYMKIVHPIQHRNSFTKRRAITSVVLIWILGYAYNSTIIPLSAVSNGACLMLVFYSSESGKRADAVIHFLLQYLLPVAVFVFCYSKMALMLRKGIAPMAAVKVAGSSNQLELKDKYKTNHHHQLQQQQPQNHTAAASSKKGITNIVKTMFVVSFAFVACLSLNQWLFFFFNLGMINYNIFDNAIYPASVISMYINCCINPIIYAVTYQQFREAVRRIFFKAKVDVFAASRIDNGTTELHV